MNRADITEPPGQVTTVRSFGNGSVTDADGWSLGCDTEGLDFPEGALLEQWGKGIGYTVRGLAIDGHVFWYRTEAEEQARLDEENAKREQEKRDYFEREGKAKLDADYESLPSVFKRRIDKFRATNPDFRWEFEAYEMSCCVDAVKIADWCRNLTDIPESLAEYLDPGAEPTVVDKIKAFYKAPWEVQKQVGLFDGHSGNSFGAAVQLAVHYAEHPERVELEHGALVPLVGCESYGCPHPWPPEATDGD